MKKLSKVATLLATGALLLGGAFLSCSSDGLPPELGGGSGSGAGSSGGGGGAGGSGGDGTKTKLTAVADSWDFVSQADTVAWVASLPKSLSTDGTVSLTSNIDIAGADGKLTLSLLKENGIEKFSTALGANGNSDPSFSYVDPALGLRIKGSAIKIADVQGKIGLKIEWVGGASRSLGIYRGTSDTNPIVKAVDSTGTEKEATGNSGAIKVYEQDPIDEIIDTFLYEKGDLYIVAGNNIYIKSIGITNAGDAVTTVTLKVPTAVDDTTGAITWGDVADYDIGSASIKAAKLEEALKANTGNNATIKKGLALAKETLIAEAEEEGVTFTEDDITTAMFDLTFSETEDGTPLETIASGKTVYVGFEPNDTFEKAVANAKSGSISWTLYSTTGTKSEDEPTFASGSIELAKQTAIVLDQAYTATTAKTIKVQFDISYDDYYTDRGQTKLYVYNTGSDKAGKCYETGVSKLANTADNQAVVSETTAGDNGKISGGALDGEAESYASGCYAVFVSSAGVSKGTKQIATGGSSNGFTLPSKLLTVTGNVDGADLGKDITVSKNTNAGETVTYTFEYDLTKTASDSATALTGTVSTTGASGTLTDTKTLKGSDMRWNNANSATVATSLRPYIANATSAAVTISNIKVFVDNAAVKTAASE